MSPPRLTLLPLLLLLAIATTASAQRVQTYRPAPGVSSTELDQTIYKGLVGNVLDAIPMDPTKRVTLQRANAVISNTASGRTLAVLAGLSNPVLMIVGLVWGAWAASNIKPVENATILTADSKQPGEDATAATRVVAIAAQSPAADDTPVNSEHDVILASLNISREANETALLQPRVVRIWLPERSTMQSQ